MCRSKFFLIIILMPVSVLWSCAQLKTLVQTNNIEAESAPPAKHDSNTTIEPSAQAVRLAKNKMNAGEYQKAIDIYEVAKQNHPQDKTLLKEYTKSIEKIKTIASEVFNQGDFVSALRHYDILKKNYPRLVDSSIKLSFTISCIDEKFSICKKTISRQGFEEYRKGNLSKSIALWQALLDVDQNNPDIQRALEIAKLQQKNLQK